MASVGAGVAAGAQAVIANANTVITARNRNSLFFMFSPLERFGFWGLSPTGMIIQPNCDLYK
jgi:hypothetical protein